MRLVAVRDLVARSRAEDEAPPVAPPPVAAAPVYTDAYQNQAQYWYYCQASQGYYPYVSECPSGWLQVVPQNQ